MSEVSEMRLLYARYWLLLSVFVIILDQLTKLWAQSVLLYHQPVPVMPMLNLTLAYNTGAAFSFLSDAGGWQRWFFIVLTLIVSGVILHWIWTLRAQESLHAAALALILGGAIGNLIDRIWLGYVIDFIDVYYQRYHWPIFNIADSAITIGVTLLIYNLFVNQRNKSDDE